MAVWVGGVRRISVPEPPASAQTPGGLSDPMIAWSPTCIHAWAILSFQSGPTGASGMSPKVIRFS